MAHESSKGNPKPQNPKPTNEIPETGPNAIQKEEQEGLKDKIQ